MIFRIDERKVVILTVRHSRREFDYEELNEG